MQTEVKAIENHVSKFLKHTPDVVYDDTDNWANYLGFRSYKLGTNMDGNIVFITFATFDFPSFSEYQGRNTNGQACNRNGDMCKPDYWSFNIPSDSLKVSEKNRFEFPLVVKKDALKLGFTETPGWNVNNIDYANHYLLNCDTIEEILPYIMQECPLCIAKASIWNDQPKDNRAIHGFRNGRDFMYETAVKYIYYKRLPKKIGKLPITGENIVKAYLHLADLKAKDAMFAEKAKNKNKQKMKLKKLSMTTDLDDVFEKRNHTWDLKQEYASTNTVEYVASVANTKRKIRICINMKTKWWTFKAIGLKLNQTAKDDTAMKFLDNIVTLLDNPDFHPAN